VLQGRRLSTANLVYLRAGGDARRCGCRRRAGARAAPRCPVAVRQRAAHLARRPPQRPLPVPSVQLRMAQAQASPMAAGETILTGTPRSRARGATSASRGRRHAARATSRTPSRRPSTPRACDGRSEAEINASRKACAHWPAMCIVLLGSDSRDLKVGGVCVERVKVVTVVRDRSVHGDDRLRCGYPRPEPRTGRLLERCPGIRAEPDLTGRTVPGAT
jgi:hypothetical protein